MRSIGKQYEQRAVEMLCAAGLHILERNFTRKTGEIDIVAQDALCLVFLEVRLRKHPGFAGAAASVDRRKQGKIIRTAQLYLRANPRWKNAPCRFDVLAFGPRQASGELSVNWIKSAFIC
jgi:putative endonuclease